jgi:site-specific DNA recombinase
MKAIGYFVEGAKRAGSKRSVGEQNRGFLEFCAAQGYEVAGTFLDADGQVPRDAGFRQMLQFLQRDDRGFAVVAVDSLGVLGADLGQAAMRLLQIEATGAQVVSVHTGKEVARELITT